MKPRHASDQELLLFLDGELKVREADQLRAHLAACWECRVRLEETADVIRDFVEYRRRALPTVPPGGWPNLRHRLKQKESSPQTHATGLAWLSPKSLVFASLCAIGVLWFRFSSASPVSANEILDRATRNETRQIRQASLPVIHEKVLARRRHGTRSADQTDTLELWNEVKDGSTRKIGSEALWKELEEIFQTNHMGPVRPLSATAHRAWRESVHAQREEVVKDELGDGTVTWTAKTEVLGPFQRNQILEGDLTVRATDWAPVAQRLRVQGDQEVREYELAVLTYDIVERGSLPPSFFHASLSSERVQDIAVLVAPKMARATMPLSVDSNPGLDALYIIHRAGLCRNGAVEVKYGAGERITVDGVVDTVARKNEITELLKQIADVAVSIRSMEEAAREAATQSSGTPPPEGDIDHITLRSAQPAAASFLADYFRTQRDGTRGMELANRALSLSSETVADAWELQRLAERFAWPKPELGIVSRRRLELMIREHLKSLDATGGLLRGLLEPVLTALTGEPAARVELPPDQSVWSKRCSGVLETQQRIRKLVQVLLVDGEGADPFAAATELLSAFADIETRLLSLEARLGEDFRESNDLALKN
jgi:hypothetical protein